MKTLDRQIKVAKRLELETGKNRKPRNTTGKFQNYTFDKEPILAEMTTKKGRGHQNQESFGQEVFSKTKDWIVPANTGQV